MFASSFLILTLVPQTGAAQETTSKNPAPTSTSKLPDAPKPIPRSEQLATAAAGEPSGPDSNAVRTIPEYWVGWMDTSDRQLRWVLQFNRSGSVDGPIVSGFTWNPDINSTPNPLTKFELNDQYWKLEWNQASGKESLKYEAIQETETRATGFIIINDKTLAVPLNKTMNLPPETARNLGADIVWLDQLPPSPQNTNAKRFDLRLRFYTEGPFAVESPRIVLDSMAAQLMGVPVTLEQNEDEYLQFQIPALKANYRAKLDDSEEKMAGKFARNGNESELTLHLLNEEKAPSAPAPDSNAIAGKDITGKDSAQVKPSPKSDSASKVSEEPPQMPAEKADANAMVPERVKINIQGPVPSKLTHDLAPNEKAFILDTQLPGAKTSSGTALPSRILGGTISYSLTVDKSPAPALIILTTYDKNDRDGTVSTTKFYKLLAEWFAKRGITTVRLDDRGVGESELIPNMSTEDALRDVTAILEMLRNDPLVAKGQIGLFGHGEGAQFAMRMAGSNPNIAFNILFAPPGVNGFELTKHRLIHSAMNQGLSRPDAERLADFQRSLQEIAVTNSGNLSMQIQSVRELIARRWRVVAPLSGSNADLNQPGVREAVEQSLLSQVQAFDTPIVREALESDPSTQIMLGATPTLVLTGALDNIVEPTLNLEPLKTAALRGQEGRYHFVELPQINHWFTSATTNNTSASTGDSVTTDQELAVDPKFFRAIDDWLTAHGF